MPCEEGNADTNFVFPRNVAVGCWEGVTGLEVCDAFRERQGTLGCDLVAQEGYCWDAEDTWRSSKGCCRF